MGESREEQIALINEKRARDDSREDIP